MSGVEKEMTWADELFEKKFLAIKEQGLLIGFVDEQGIAIQPEIGKVLVYSDDLALAVLEKNKEIEITHKTKEWDVIIESLQARAFRELVKKSEEVGE